MNNSKNNPEKNEFECLVEMINNLTKSIEVIEGKLNIVEEIDNIKVLLQQDSSTTINKQQNNVLKPSNLEEEVLLNLGEYGEKIIKQLTLASRHYALNKDKIENCRVIEEKHQDELIKRKEEYKKQGKLDVVDSICAKYENLDNIFKLETIEGGIIQRILDDAGLEMIEEYSNGKIIEITNENRVELEGKISFSISSLGKYKITKSAYELNGNIKQKAEVEKIKE